MDTNKTQFSREELYALVWSKPMTKLAKEFGFSDNGLRKICKKHNIPLPNGGYWVKKEFNKAESPPPLPRLKHGEPSVIEIIKKEPATKLSSKLSIIYPPETQELLDFESLPENQIKVPERLTAPHAMTGDILRTINKKGPGTRNLLDFTCMNHLDFSVSLNTFDRALRIMDALLKAFTKRKFNVSIGHKQKTYVHILGAKIQFGLRETYKQKVKVFTAKELKEREKVSWLRDSTEYEFIPTGKLCLTIKEWANGRYRSTWQEDEKTNLESCLNRFIVSLIKAAAFEIERELEREREKQEYLKAQRQREEFAARIKAEEARVKALMDEALAWIQSNQLRQYIEAVQASAIKKHGCIEPGSKLEQWLTWAQQQAERLDPLCENSPSTLDKK